MTAIKVRRAGLGISSTRKPKFRIWLDEQPRKALTYRPKDLIRDRDGNGWRNEEFVLEANKRGVEVHWGTALKWAAGTQPRYLALSQLRKAFPTIQF
jgi:hypothetical protein